MKQYSKVNDFRFTKTEFQTFSKAIDKPSCAEHQNLLFALK
jgi:hypothetical protein